MKVFIHRRGPGGQADAIELAAAGKRIQIDLGLPMDTEASIDAYDDLGVSRYLTRGLLATILAEPDPDHACYARVGSPKAPIAIDQQGSQVLQAAHLFRTRENPILDHQILLEDRVKIVIGPFAITPYRTGGGLLNSYALEVAADHQRLFYTGGLFNYEIQGEVWQRLSGRAAGPLDAVLVHGFADVSLAHTALPPEEASSQFAGLIRHTPGLALVWMSGQHLARLVDLTDACHQTGRRLVMDLYTAEILRLAGADIVPRGEENGIYVFLPEFQRRHIRRDAMFHSLLRYPQARVFPDQLKATPSQYTLLFRPSLMEDLTRMGCLYGAQMIYCLWQGYLKQPRLVDFRQWCSHHDIPITGLEAEPYKRKRLIPQFLHRMWSDLIVPVNAADLPGLQIYFRNVEAKPDGRWWEIGSDRTWDYDSINETFQD